MSPLVKSITEALSAKAYTEETILHAIRNFQDATGLSVTALNLKTVDRWVYDEAAQIGRATSVPTALEMEVRL